jgi:NaMN:DMB phosphoribosyltransferase
MFEALETRRVLFIDGFIVSAVALALCQHAPEARAGLLFAHQFDSVPHLAPLHLAV